jgi:hypothetical protein
MRRSPDAGPNSSIMVIVPIVVRAIVVTLVPSSVVASTLSGRWKACSTMSAPLLPCFCLMAQPDPIGTHQRDLRAREESLEE